MKSFLSRYGAKVKGVLSGFDRVRFRGTIRWLANTRGMYAWLHHKRVLLKEFKVYALALTEQIKQSTQQLADQADRPVVYLPSSSTRKEDVAREIAQRDQITQGLVCVLTCVEPCRTFTVGPNRAEKKLELRLHQGRCLHHYFYLIDAELGWLNVRLQTWLPFTVNIVINGREWLAQSLQDHQMDFQRRGNCFVEIPDISTAQQLMDQQLRTSWSPTLDRLLHRTHLSQETLFGEDRLVYYWSADETEWATDVMFRSADDLQDLYPRLVRHAVSHFDGNDVLRFLGKRPLVQTFRSAELTSHLGKRCEGVRIKHALGGNSVKMYDKQQSVLRVETTLTQTRQMKVYRASEDNPQGAKSWQKLRKGVADLHRRAEISQKSNERYLESLAAVDCEQTLSQAIAPLCQRTTWKGRSVRALNPLSADDAALLEAVYCGKFAINGFRNRDICKALFAENTTLTKRQKTTRVTRLIRLLRAHGLVHKVPKTHRYILSPSAHEKIAVLLAARDANTRKLTELAA